jgi:hypothetical protein
MTTVQIKKEIDRKGHLEHTLVHKYQQEEKYEAIHLDSAPLVVTYHRHSMLQQRSYMQMDQMMNQITCSILLRSQIV